MRVAVVGLGFMGSMHLKALRSIPGAEIAAVYSSDPTKLSGDLSGIQGNLGGAGERFDFANVTKYTEIPALLADPSIDAVDLCLPTDLHASVTLAALRAGKHVLVEKPMALDGESARGMIAEALRQNRILMSGQVLRFFPTYQVLREKLRNGDLGPVRWAMFRRRCAAPAWSKWLTDPARGGGGVFDLLIHDVDMCLHLFGRPQTLTDTGFEALPAGIDLISAELHYSGPFTVHVTGGWHHPKSYPFSMEYTVATDGGTLEYSSSGRAPTLYRADGEAEALTVLEADAFTQEITYFLNCCRSGSQPDLCSPQESADAVTLTQLMLKSRKQNGELIECKL